MEGRLILKLSLFMSAGILMGLFWANIYNSIIKSLIYAILVLYSNIVFILYLNKMEVKNGTRK